jgi:hypothetical protein
MLETLKATLPELLSVTICAALAAPTAWFPNDRLEGETLAVAIVPVPESATVCGLPAAPSETISVAARLPLAEGVKVTRIVQLLLAASDVPQAFVCEKSAAVAPDNAMLVMESDALPVFDNVTVCGELLVETD